MTKTELIRRVARDTRFHQEYVAEVVDSFLKLVAEELGAGRTVELPGFGSWYTRVYTPGKTINFKTGKEMKVAPLYIPAFKAGVMLKKAARRRTPRKENPKGK